MPDQVRVFSLDSRTSETSADGKALREFCRTAHRDPAPAARNISDSDWANRPETLLHCLYRELRFDEPRGRFYGVSLNDKMIAAGGIYRAEFNPEQIAVAGVRTYTVPEHRDRFWHGDTLIPEQIRWAQSQNLKSVVFSFNRESLPLMGLLRRAIGNKAGVFGLSFPDIYKNLKEHPRAVRIKNTPQRILKLDLVPDFSWDYSAIECEEIDGEVR